MICQKRNGNKLNKVFLKHNVQLRNASFPLTDETTSRITFFNHNRYWAHVTYIIDAQLFSSQNIQRHTTKRDGNFEELNSSFVSISDFA